jgi:hypothetical protein
LTETLGAPGLSGVQRERLHYELGLTLEAGGSTACAHWKRHIGSFGTRRHAAELAKRLARCKPD